MKKIIAISFTIALVMAFTATPQIQRGKKQSQTKTKTKIEKTNKPSSNKNNRSKVTTSKPVQKSSTSNKVAPISNGNGTITANQNSDNTSDLIKDKYPFRRVGKCPVSDRMNPMDCGIILGWTTVEEAIAAGAEMKSINDHQHLLVINGCRYWDHDGDGIIESFSVDKRVPESWKKAGISTFMKYNAWLSWLRQNGFIVKVDTSDPEFACVYSYNDSNGLTFFLYFSTTDKNDFNGPSTKVGISVSRKRISTATTDLGKFFPFMGVFLGKTLISELPKLGMSMSTANNEYVKTGGFDRSVRFRNNTFGGSVVTEVQINNKELPEEWLNKGESNVMTYNNCIKFLTENGFHITQNDMKDNPEETHQKLKAVNAELGLSFTIHFKSYKKFSISSDGDDPSVVDYYVVSII